MLVRIIASFLLMQTIACHKVTNAISTTRLDCGQEVSWEDSYLKFVDSIGNPLSENMLNYHSLEDQSSHKLRLSSKGCLALEKSGLWLIRHREKPEGVIVDFSKVSESAALQLQDISQENLKPSCPSYETGHRLNLNTVLEAQSKHDLRGYEINFSFRSDSLKKIWPRQNFSFLQPIELAGVYPEGVFNVDLTVTNNFRGGEQTTKSCPVKFDYTGPIIAASLHQGQPKTYKGRPFIVLGSDQDVRFTSPADDFSSFEVCYQRRTDWDSGEDLGGFQPVCEKPERIPKDRPIPFDSRRGFWQVQYRGFDPAGNASGWSEPLMILFEQQTARQKIVNRMNSQSTDLLAWGYAATPMGMLASLEIYKEWQSLPTAFEREEMESSILLTLHRPWMEPSVQVIMRVVPDNHYPRIAFPVLGGKKFVSIEIVSELEGGWHFEATLTDVESNLAKSLTPPDHLPNGWQVSKDGTQFFWFTTEYVYYGKLNGSDVRFQTLAFKDDYISSVRFLDSDTQLVVYTSMKNKLTYFSTDNELTEINQKSVPLDFNEYHEVPSIVPITDDTNGILVKDFEQNSLSVWSLFEEGSRKLLDFNPELVPTFSISMDGIKVLDTDRHLFVSLSYTNRSYCSFYYYNAEVPDQHKAERLLETMPCNADVSGTPLGNEVWMHGPGDLATVVYKPGSAEFRKSLLNPELPAKQIIGKSLDRYITESGTWMFSGSEEDKEPDEEHGRARAWKRNKDGDFEPIAEFWTCDEISEPYGFQFDEATKTLYHICNNARTVFSIWDLSANPPRFVNTIDVGAMVTNTLLVNDQLLIGGALGNVYVYDLYDRQKPTLNSIIKLGDQQIKKLTYDASSKLLYATGARGDKPLKVWEMNNFTKPKAEIRAFSKEMERTVLSRDRKFLAASSEENSRVLLWNTENQQSIFVNEHANRIRDISFIGDTSILASGASNGILKLSDVKNPDMPAVTFSPGLSNSIKNIATVPGSNEFIVETDNSRIFHYRLESFDKVLQRTCTALRSYLNFVRDDYRVYAEFCKSL